MPESVPNKVWEIKSLTVQTHGDQALHIKRIIVSHRLGRYVISCSLAVTIGSYSRSVV